MASNPAQDKNGDGKPDSWSSSWYNQSKGQYVWPGYLKQDVPNADLEVLWAMDDNLNNEFPYLPIPADKTKRGLGVKIEGRSLQWSNSLAQNCIFFVYTVQNYSDKNLDTIYFGMYGDVDNGGGVAGGAGGAENLDDLGYFISPLDSLHRVTGVPVPLYSRSIVYFWDANGLGYQNRPAHYDACKFLESPGNTNDVIDNDGDGMVDESQTNEKDDDKDWNPLNDDVGIDGVSGTNDLGEGDGNPTPGKRLTDGTLNPLFPGEPNFELTDLDESDQIGLTAFRSFAIGELEQKNDTAVWGQLQRNFLDMDNIPTAADIAFIYGSGKTSLKMKGVDGSVKRFSIALLMGSNLNDILISARTVQLIYNQNYQFIRAPDKPVVTAVPDNKKVTLYWSSNAEESVDPILGKDFEGYMIYRSLDPQFGDINTITDGFGTPMLYAPLIDRFGKVARWDVAKRPEPLFEDDTSSTKNGIYDAGERYIDVNGNGSYDASLVDDYWKGFSPVPYDQRGVAFYLGDNTGLQHSYVDSFNVINGQTYYYAVVSFDHGYITDYPPSECTKRISIDPITSQLTYDVNTVSVVPGPRVNGYIPPKFKSGNQIDHSAGTGTGPISLQIMDDLDVKDNIEYSIIFSDSLVSGNTKIAKLNYRVVQITPITVSLFISDTQNVKIGNKYLLRDDVLSVSSEATGHVFTEGVDYVIDTLNGLIRKTVNGTMNSSNGPFKIVYRYLSLSPSTGLSSEESESNGVFDGMKLFVSNEVLSRDSARSGFVIDKGNFNVKMVGPSLGSEKIAPIDFQIQFTSSDTLPDGKYAQPGDTLLNINNQKVVIAPFKIKNITKDPVRGALPFRVLTRETVTGNKKWDVSEAVIFLTPAPYGSGNNAMAELRFTFKDSTKNSFGGEVYNVLTRQPFTVNDKFTFTTISAKYNSSLSSTALDKIKVVPNPYIAVNDIEPTNRLPGTTRGSRRIYFEHLPVQCVIRIYTLSGELVKELNHSSGIENGREYWDLLNRDNIGVAYGVYIAHVEAKGVGEKILKFALIK